MVAHLLLQENRLGMADKIRWGILGTGNMARQFAAGLATLDDAVLTAVASRTLNNAQKFADRFSIAGVFGNYADFAAQAPVDVVYVSTPHDSHAANSIMCL
jgi:predicted dehydrogenase